MALDVLLSDDSSSLNFPSIRPTLDLHLARTKSLDPRITFTRASGGSYIGPDGLIKYAGVNQPRFDHDPMTGESLGLMIGEQRINIILQSEDFSNNQISNNVSIKTNQISSPDGSLTADLLTSTLSSVNNTCYVQQLAAISESTLNYVASCFVKMNTCPVVSIQIAFISGTNVEYTASFNFYNKSMSGSSSSTYGYQEFPNGWFRIWIAAPNNGNGTGVTHRIYARNNSTSNVIGDSVFLWGRMIEQGLFPTSYIPTVTSQRTRAADNVSMTGVNFSSWYNQNEGTVYSKSTVTSYNTIIGASNSAVWSILTSGAANQITLSLTPGGGDTPNYRCSIVANGISQFASNLTTTPSQYISTNSTALTYSINDIAATINGKLNNTSNKATLPTPNTLIFTNVKNHSLILSRFTYYPKRLPNSQLQVLTG